MYGLNFFDVMHLPFVQYEGMANALEKYERDLKKQRQEGGGRG